jgi:2-desacetyl-2-hydroxyethyl bacteriochlorophyllide A dehydrogenase
MATPRASIIIRTFNEERHLPALLESLGSQSFRDYEIVVVDSGSVDRTRELATPWADKLLHIDSHDFTFGYSLNVGIQASSSPFAVIISAHTLPTDENWLEALVRPLEDEPTAMTYGRQLGWQNFSEGRDLDRTFGSKPRVEKPPRFFAHNGNSAIRKDLWEEHPFDESLPGLEDIEWAKHWMLKGYQVVYEPKAALYHIHDENWRQVRRRYYREAVAARWIGVKGRRHAILDSAKELGYALLDLSKNILPAGGQNGSGSAKPVSKKEIVLFRTNKAIGNMRGLMDGKTMQDLAAREEMFFDRTGHAVVIHGQGRASWDEVHVPEVKPGEVLVRTAYSGVCGTDLDLFDGKVAYYKDGSAKFPIVPGHEISGHVVAIGTNVDHLKEDDPVVIEHIQGCGKCNDCSHGNWAQCSTRAELGVLGRDGGYAQFVLVPGQFIRVVPQGLEMEKAALCQPLATVLKALNRLGRVWPESPVTKRCAVVGAGSLGHMCARVLAHRGHDVTVFDRDPKRLDYFTGTGIQTASDSGAVADFDVLVEVTGDPEALDNMLRLAPSGATILLLGLSYSQRPFPIENIVAHDKTVVGSAGCGPEEYKEALSLMLDLDLSAYLQCVLPLDQYRDAWNIFRERKHIKVLLSAAEAQS